MRPTPLKPALAAASTRSSNGIGLISLGPNAQFGVTSHSLLGHLGYDKSHLDQLIGFVASGRLDVSGSISDVMPLDDVVRGVERLATKEGDPIRLVVAP